jgi:hypothetical protein
MLTKRQLSFLIGGLLLCGGPSLVRAGDEERETSLRRIESNEPDGQFPLWLSTSEATQEGYIKWEEFSRGGGEVIQALVSMAKKAAEQGSVKASEDGCTVWTHQGKRHDYIPNKTLEELATHFGAIYRGRVTASAQGFIDGWPGTLYAMDVESASLPSPAQAFFYFPIARIEAEGVTLCHSGNRYPDQPQIGRQVLIFARGSVASLTLVLEPQDEEILFEREDGTLSLPKDYGEAEDGLSLETIEKRATQLASAADEGDPDSGVMP